MPVRPPFLWAGGIENTFITAKHSTTGKTLEEYQLTRHYDRWRADLSLAASAGINSIRWGIPWYRVEAARGRYDWAWTDEVVDYLLEELHIEPIVDLIHYGTPDWLPQAILDPEFRAAFAEYVEAFAARYEHRVHYATPVNEPYTAAKFCGQRGDWPPYETGDAGFARILVALSGASVEASRSLQRRGMAAVHVEVASGAYPLEPSARAAAERFTLQNELYWDLITARVDESHPLFEWLLSATVRRADLDWFLENADASAIDLMGINYYPQWSYSVMRGAPGGLEEFAVNGGASILDEHLRRFWEKYRLPMMITETSVKGASREKSEWLSASTEVVRRAIERGIDIRGYTWFPMLDMIDWEYRNHTGGAEDFLIDLGLWDLNRGARTAISTYRNIIEAWQGDEGSSTTKL